TLSGSASLADYQTALQAVTFENTSDNPDTTARTITVVVNDGDTNSATRTTTIAITAVNDAPVLTGDLSATVNEGGDYTILAADLGYTDPDDVDAGIAFNVSSLANGTILVNGTAATTFTNTQLTAGQVVFRHDGSETTTASFTINVEDGDEDSSTPANSTFNFTVTPVNDAPILNTTNAVMPNINEDPAAPAGAVGVTVSSVAAATGSDADTGGGLTGIAITGVNSQGTLFYSINSGVTWTSVTTPSDTSALVLSSTALLYFQSNANVNGAISDAFTFRGWDGTDSKTAGTSHDISSELGGSNAFSPNTKDASIYVTPVNDAPSATDNTLSVNEDTGLVLTAADFGYSDTEGTTMASITISSLPGAGSLALNGVVVTANQVISKASIDANQLVFTPAANENGSGYATFQFTVSDGSLNSVSPNTITLNVNAVNDAPTASDNTIAILEDGSHTFTAADFGYSDVEGSALDKIIITSLPSSGTFQLNGTNVSVNDEITAADIGNLVFTPAADANGAGYATFDFKVNDGALDSVAANSITVDVTAVNDLPTAADNNITIPEDGSHTFAASEFGFSDTADGDSLVSVTVTSLPGAGDLRLNGVAVSLNQVIATAAIPNLVFTPAANTNGTGYASFQFTVNDGTDNSASANTITVDVTASNDAPTGTDNTLTILEDGSHTFAATDFGFNDIDSGDNLAEIQITSLPSLAGALELNGVAVTLNQVITLAQIPTLVFTPAANANGAGYDSFEFKVSDGTDFSASGNTITVDVTAQNDAPTAADNTVTVDEDNSHTFTTSEFGFSDIDAGDTLTSITVTTLPTPGTLTLSGSNVTAGDTITAANISNLVFTPAADANGAGYASFQFRVNDGTTNSVSTYTMTVDVTPVNDAPVFTGPATLTAVTEDTADPAGATVNSLFGTLFSNPEESSETLQGIVITSDTSNSSQGVWEYKVGSGSWTAIGVVTQNAGLLLSSSTLLRFVPAANFNGTPDGGLYAHAVDSSASVTYTDTTREVFDTTSDNNTESNVSQAAVLLTTSITAVNDAPVLSDTNLALPNVNEDQGDPTGSVGMLVSGLTGGVTDPEQGAHGIAVTDVNSNGTLHYSLDNGSSWNEVIVTASDTAALLFSSATRLYFEPNANYNTYISDAITFRAWDGTTGSATSGSTPTTADASTNGGSTAFSGTTDTVAQTIIAINDAPSFTLVGNQSVNEDAGAQTVTSFATSISANDVGQTLTSFNITTSNDAAFATLPTVDVTTGQLTYETAANWHGTVTITVTLSDNGGTANGGVDTSSAQTFDIVVAPVNDAPVLSDTNLALPNVNEDQGDPIGSVGMLVSGLTGGVTDLEQGAHGIAVTGVSSNGTLHYSLDNGSSWNEVIVTASDTAALLFSSSTRLYFAPSADYNTYISDAITFRAWDGTTGSATSGSTPTTADTSTNGGSTAFSGTTDTVAQNIIAINDAPSFNLTGNQAVNEDAGAQTVTSFATSISANDAGQTLTSFNITTSNDAAFATLPAIDVNTGQLTYETAANWHGTVTITVTLSDNGGTANGGVDTSSAQTFDIVVAAVNDAPVLDNTQSPSLPNIHEDAPDPVGNVGQMVSSLLTGATDVEGDSLGIAVTEVSTLGKLWYSIDGGTNWSSTTETDRSDSSALLLNSTALVYFQGDADEHGSISDAFTFRAWDGTTGSNGGVVDASSNGGSTAFSSNDDTVSITILSVNDVPQFTVGIDQTIQEDVDGLNTSPTQVTVTSFVTGISEGFTGATTNEGSQNLTFTVTTDNDAAFATLPVLTRSTLNTSVADLTYTLNQDWNGGPITITVTLSDDGGTDNGGVSVSQPQTFTITATAVNDAPILADDSLAFTHMTEDGVVNPVGEVGRLVSEFTAAASDIEQADATLGVAITGVNQYVTLWYGIESDGSNWVWAAINNPDVADNNALLLDSTARIYLQPKPDVNTGATANHTPGVVDPIAAAITFRAWDRTNATINADGSSSLNGTKSDASTNGTTTAFSSFEEQVSVMVDPVVDIADDTFTFDEDITTTLDVLLNDSFDTSAQVTHINGVSITANGNSRTYTITDPGDGNRVIGAVTIATDGRSLSFDPAEDWHGSTKTFTYRVTSENNTEDATVT
ncbi:MAG: beta strand repeat-containing protein, partial [Endozoicomonas sp.]